MCSIVCTDRMAILQIAERIRPTVDKYHQTFPTVLEIPSKDHPYGKCVLWIAQLLLSLGARPFEGFHIETCSEAGRRLDILIKNLHI